MQRRGLTFTALGQARADESRSCVVATVEEFKGLESKCVVVIHDRNDPIGTSAYVGITRSNIVGIFASDSESVRILAESMSKSIEAVVK